MKPKFSNFNDAAFSQGIPEFKELSNLHIFMAATYLGRSYSLEAPDEYGFKFCWLIDNNTGDKMGEFPVAFMRAQPEIVRYLPVITENIYTEIALLMFASIQITAIIGALSADNQSNISEEAIKILEEKDTEIIREFIKVKKALRAG